MKRSTQSWTVVTRFAPLFLLAGISLSGTLIFPQSASADHVTNRPDVEKGLRENDGGNWIVIYSKELSQAEEAKLAICIAADVTVAAGSCTSTYFSNFAQESFQKLLQEAAIKAPSAVDQIRRELTLNKVLGAIKASFNGKQVSLSIAGMDFQVGRATYNRAECALGVCVPTPNTYQPYIRFRVASSAGQQNTPSGGTALFRIRNRWNPYCLASIGDSKSIDNRVGMGTCDSSNSIWRWDGQQIRNGWNPNCLGSIGNSKEIDNRAVMGACGQSNAVWRWDGRQIKNGWNPYCLGSIGNSKAVDNPVVMGACGQSNAEWFIEPI